MLGVRGDGITGAVMAEERAGKAEEKEDQQKEQFTYITVLMPEIC